MVLKFIHISKGTGCNQNPRITVLHIIGLLTFPILMWSYINYKKILAILPLSAKIAVTLMLQKSALKIMLTTILQLYPYDKGTV